MVAPHLTDEVRPLVSPVPATLQLVDRPSEDGPASVFEKLSTRLTSELAEELYGAAEWLGVRIEEILLAALGRALGRTRGEGALAVDVIGPTGPPIQCVALMCSAAPAMGPTEMLQGAHTALAGPVGSAGAPSQVLLNLTANRNESGGHHVLELRVLELRVSGDASELQLDWWYDTRSLDPYSVEELAEQFPRALIEITSDAAPPL
ncbi:MAG: hypothetical protein AB7G47_17280 [Mycolicibacterium sp.]|uniref:hypothetical protein n=1 Tax=Mycolicibacterium sp. TaxID=2320850 RepID=UPI003D0E7730